MADHRLPCAPRRGLTLVEVTVALAVVAVLSSVALPSFRSVQLRSHRADAANSLQRVQLAQEKYREKHGGYAERLDQLAGAFGPRSQQGFYQLELRSRGDQAYELVALAQGEQAQDNACRTVTLRVEGALTFFGPEAACWHS